MSSNELYNLRWNDYSSTLSASVGTLLDDSDFIDVTLACEGQSFSGHKLVLSACSGYLKKLLRRNPCQHPIVILKDVRAAVLNSLLHFMYHGAVDVPEDQLNDFLNAAQALEVKGLAEEDLPKPPSSEPPAKKARVSAAPPPRSFVPSHTPTQHTSVISVKQARNLVESGALQDAGQRVSVKPSRPVPRSEPSASNSVINRLQSSELSITPSGGDDSVSKDGVKLEDDESDLEIVEPELSNLKEEPEQSSMQDEDTSFSESMQQDYSLNEKFSHGEAGLEEGSLEQDYMYDDGQSSQAGPSGVMEGIPQGVCPFCGKIFSTKLKRHVERVHLHKPYEDWEPCTFCYKRFKTRDNLFNHMYYAHGMKRAEYRALTEADVKYEHLEHIPHPYKQEVKRVEWGALTDRPGLGPYF